MYFLFSIGKIVLPFFSPFYRAVECIAPWLKARGGTTRIKLPCPKLDNLHGGHWLLKRPASQTAGHIALQYLLHSQWASARVVVVCFRSRWHRCSVGVSVWELNNGGEWDNAVGGHHDHDMVGDAITSHMVEPSKLWNQVRLWRNPQQRRRFARLLSCPRRRRRPQPSHHHLR